MASGIPTLGVSAGACLEGIAGIDLGRKTLRNEVIMGSDKIRLRRQWKINAVVR